VDAPSNGSDLSLQVSYSPAKNMTLIFRFRNKKNTLNPSDNKLVLSPPLEAISQTCRIHFNWQIGPSLESGTRIEWKNYKKDGSPITYGHLLLQDFKYSFFQKKAEIIIRLGLFDISDYDARIYAYENDLLYSFAVPSFYGSGYRRYLLFRYKINKQTDFWIKFGETIYPGSKTNGSALNLITGEKKSELRGMIRIKF
jgi:hypothetical protein